MIRDLFRAAISWWPVWFFAFAVVLICMGLNDMVQE